MKSLLLVASLMLLAGCSKTAEQDDDTPGASAPEHVWEEQVQTLDDARQVEQTLMDAQRRRDEQLQEQQR